MKLLEIMNSAKIVLCVALAPWAKSTALAQPAQVQVNPLQATAPVTMTAQPKLAAQRLVEETMSRHKHLVLCFFHVTPPGQKDNIVIAANRLEAIGHKSDGDDLDVSDTGVTVIELQPELKRIEVLIPLLDRSGKRLGALGLVFPHLHNEMQAAYVHQAELIRLELQGKTASREALFIPVRR